MSVLNENISDVKQFCMSYSIISKFFKTIIESIIEYKQNIYLLPAFQTIAI